MKIKVINRSRHKLPEYSAVLNSPGTIDADYRGEVCLPVNLLKILFIILILPAIISCTRKIVPAEGESKNDDFDSASYNYVYVEALKQKLMGNGGDALKYLEECVRLNPSSDAAYYQMAQILIARGDIKNGKKFLTKALSLDNENIWYLTMLAGLYYQEKNIDSAIVYYERAVNYFPEKENLQLALGNLYSENQNYDKANSIFESFDKKYGVNEKSTISEIRNLIAEEKYDAALNKTIELRDEFPDEILYNGLLADIYKFKGDKQKAREVYNELLERNPDNPQVQLSICDFLIGEKNYEELFTLLTAVVMNNNVERESKISLMARIIEIPDLGKEWEDKLSISLMVLEANYSEDNIVPLLRPELMIRQNRLTEASARLEELVRSNPDNYYAWEKLLIVYLQLKDYNKLFSKGQECATKFNTSYTAKLLYANGAIELGKYDIAIEELKKAEILAGDNKEFLLQVLTMRADVYYRMKEYENAFATFESALKLNNDDLTVINNYAYYLAEQNTNLKEAEEMAKRVVETEKGNTTYLDTYGWVLYKRGKLQEAAKVMESIINSGEKPDAVWFEHYGYILKKEKKCKEAISNWNTALKLDSTKTELIREIENCEK
jgi:tetratricopeptide (TPR) repeat protein